MAGDWTKIRASLFEDPRVISIASTLNLSRDDVVGKLARAWLWAGNHTTNGTVRFCDGQALDAVIGVPNFSVALTSVGWLELVESGGVRFPRWDKHNDKAAKARLLAAERASRSRHGAPLRPSRKTDTKSAPTEEKRTEEQSREQAMPAKDKNSIAVLLARGNACSMLARIGMDEGAIRYLTNLAGVDDCLIEWAVTRFTEERQARRKIDNPAGYVRALIEKRKVPPKWRDAWNKTRLAAQTERLTNGVATI